MGARADPIRGKSRPDSGCLVVGDTETGEEGSGSRWEGVWEEGTHGSPGLRHQNAAEGKMRGHHGVTPVHGVRSPLAPVSSWYWGGCSHRAALRREGSGAAGEYSRAASVPPTQGGGWTYEARDAAGWLPCLHLRCLREPLGGPLSSLDAGAKQEQGHRKRLGAPAWV